MAIFLPVTSAGYSRPWTKEQIVARGIQKRKFAAQQKARLMAPENKTKFNEANPGLIDALRELTSWNSFAASLVEQFDDRGSLSEKQTGAAVAMLMKVKANKANRPEAPTVDLSNVVAMFNKAHEAIKTPKFRFEDLVISRAPDTGANAGALYVKVDGEYAGKVKEELRKLLSQQGVLLIGKELDHMMFYLITCAKNQQHQFEAEIMRRQFGWADNDSKFILGDKEIGTDTVKFSPPSPVTERLCPYFEPKGTLEEWKKVVSVYNMPNFEPHSYFVCLVYCS